MLSNTNKLPSTQTQFILIDDQDDIRFHPNPPADDFAAFSKDLSPKEREIIIVDSTEDESEKSLLKETATHKKIAKSKPNLKKIRLCKRKPLFRLDELHKAQPLPLSNGPSLETQTTAASLPLDPEQPCPLAPMLQPAPEKALRVGAKFQASLPKFEFSKANNDRLADIVKSKEWDPCLIRPQDFSDCKTLIQSILELNFLSDDYVCRFLKTHNYKIEDTVNHVCMNKDKLQREIIGSYIPSDPLFRKTRNSLYNKFLLRKL